MTQTVVQVRGQSRSAAAPGTRLSDVYEIEEMIAAGGMGEIYRGKLIETGDSVAIKMIKPEFAENESVLALFRKEASALHRLNHDSIVRYYVFSVDRKLNRPYLSMEFVEGNTLSEILRTRALDLEAVNRFRKRIAAGLQVAHDQGIIHRDISPDNFILPEDDVRRAKIIDFGIARSTKLGQATVIGDGFAGKYNYVSPEQLGMHGGDVTNRSDIYSFGLVLAECLLGKAIDMGGSQVDVIDKRRGVPDLSRVDEKLRPLITQMLQPDPKDRPQSMTEVAEWEWVPPVAQPKKPNTASPGEGAAAGRKSNSGMMIGGGAAALAAAGVIGWFVFKPQDTAQAPPAQRPVAAVTAPAYSPAVALRTNPLLQRPAPTTAAERAERVLNYIRYYDGDTCMLLLPTAVTESSATIEATVANTGSVREFMTDFKIVNGFEPTLAIAETSPQQCPAVDMLLRLDAHEPGNLILRSALAVEKAGERVRLQIEGVGQRTLSLVVVHEDGVVQDLTAEAKQSGNSIVFEGRIDGRGPARPSRKLVLAFAGPHRPSALDQVRLMPPDQLLKSLHQDLAAMGEGLSATARILRFE